MPYSPAPAVFQGVSAAPTGTASATAVMMALGGTITPTVTGRVLLLVSGDCSNDTSGDGVQIQLSYGTGSAPSNGAAVTGTQIGQIVSYLTAVTGVLTVPFALQALITGLSLPTISALGVTGASTAVWLDVAVNRVTGGTASLTNVNITAIEL